MDDRNFVEAYNRICDKQDSLKYAFNVDTGFYILPVDACKSFNMSCPKCKGKVIICVSVNGVLFFRHSDNVKWCNYYSGKWNKLRLSSCKNNITATKELIHNETIKKMVNYLNSGKKIIVNKKCNFNYRNVEDCKWLYPYEIKLEEGDKAVPEHRINETLKHADIAILNNEGNIKEIIEIYCTNKTNEENRPRDISWCELNAIDVLENIIANDDEYTCQRIWNCDGCKAENLRRQKETDKRKRLLEEQRLQREQERQDRLARAEQERLAMEALSKQEREARLARAETERLERLARAETERLEKERLELLHKEKYDNLMKLENIISLKKIL